MAERGNQDTNKRPGSIFRLAVYVLLAGGVTAAAIVATRDSGAETPVGHAESELLEAAIRTQWGDRDPTVLHSYAATTRHGDAAEGNEAILRTTFGPGGRYREERTWETFGITEVFAMDGEGNAWASFDATVVPLTEAEIERRKLQPWLFQVSHLTPLRDPERFRLEHDGRQELPDGRAVDRLRVRSRGEMPVELLLDFDVDTRLLAEVTLLDDREQRLTVRLSDYRTVDGVQVAHRLVSLRDDVPVATQTVMSVTIDADIDEGVFERPLDLNRDAIIEKRTMGGLVARAIHHGEDDDIDDTVRDLRGWIEKSGLAIVGPLVYSPARGGDEDAEGAVSIAVTRLDSEKTPVEREDVGLRTLAPRRALCMTHVGDADTVDLVARVGAEAARRGLTVAGPPLEIFFSQDRRTRQIQLPVE